MNYVEPREKTLRTWKSGLQLRRAARDTNLKCIDQGQVFTIRVVRAIKGEQMIASASGVTNDPVNFWTREI